MGWTRLALLRALWRLAGPYWSSDDKWAGRGLLAAVIGLNLGPIAIDVRFNIRNNDFYNAVREFSETEFHKQIAIFIEHRSSLDALHDDKIELFASQKPITAAASQMRKGRPFRAALRSPYELDPL